MGFEVGDFGVDFRKRLCITLSKSRNFRGQLLADVLHFAVEPSRKGREPFSLDDQPFDIILRQIGVFNRQSRQQIIFQRLQSFLRQ